MSEFVLRRVKIGVPHITGNEPSRRNAVTAEISAALRAVVDAVERHPLAAFGPGALSVGPSATAALAAPGAPRPAGGPPSEAQGGVRSHPTRAAAGRGWGGGGGLVGGPG